MGAKILQKLRVRLALQTNAFTRQDKQLNKLNNVSSHLISYRFSSLVKNLDDCRRIYNEVELISLPGKSQSQTPLTHN